MTSVLTTHLQRPPRLVITPLRGGELPERLNDFVLENRRGCEADQCAVVTYESGTQNSALYSASAEEQLELLAHNWSQLPDFMRRGILAMVDATLRGTA